MSNAKKQKHEITKTEKLIAIGMAILTIGSVGYAYSLLPTKEQDRAIRCETNIVRASFAGVTIEQEGIKLSPEVSYSEKIKLAEMICKSEHLIKYSGQIKPSSF